MLYTLCRFWIRNRNCDVTVSFQLDNISFASGFYDDYDDCDNGYGFSGNGFGGGGMMGRRGDSMGDGFGMGGGNRFSMYGGGGGGGGGRMGAGSRSGGGGRDGGNSGTPGNSYQNSVTGHWIHMRGLPFQATDDDVLRVSRLVISISTSNY